MVVLDYLQLMRADNSNPSRVNEMSEISRATKALAKELDVPVIALSQLNRASETRTNKEPIMADLRDSGALEQDADLVIFLLDQNSMSLHLKTRALLKLLSQNTGMEKQVIFCFIGLQDIPLSKILH